jgi:hypothetical protein
MLDINLEILIKLIFYINMEYNYQESDFIHIYEWVDYVSLSRPKKNIARDFSDGGILVFLISSDC